MKSLSELKSSPDVGLAEYTVKVCVSAKLATELEAADQHLFDVEQRLEATRAELEAEKARAEEGDTRPRRSGQSHHADLKKRVRDLEAEAETAATASDSIRERMDESSVQVLLRGKGSGEWRRWANAHPARDEETAPAGHQRDVRFAAGFCDIDALVDDLHLWAAQYNGEPATDEWWGFVASNGVPADLTAAASRVVQMHEQSVDLGKDRRAWLADRRSATASK